MEIKDLNPIKLLKRLVRCFRLWDYGTMEGSITVTSWKTRRNRFTGKVDFWF